MNKITLLFTFLISSLTFSQQQEVNYTVNPCTFQEDDAITLTFDGASIVEADWGIGNNALYFWSWSYDINGENQEDAPNNGGWTNSSTQLTYNNGTDTYSISFVPSTFFGRTGSIGRIGFLIKALDGTGDKKSQDILLDIGSSNLKLVLQTPLPNSVVVLNSGDNLSVSAINTCGNATYVLKANGAQVDSQSGIFSYAFTHINITETKNYVLEVTTDGVTKTKTFTALVDPNTMFDVLPPNMVEGINYDSSDPTKVTLVLDAPGKDFVYIAGSFNNWQPDASYAMKRYFGTPKQLFWLEITGLTPGQIETYQYWVVDKVPNVANTPVLVKTADPYSTLVLSPFDDPGNPNLDPGLPLYPAGQEREVTVLQTGQTAYPWEVANFTKPKKEDLIIYEVLIRDFDADRNFQDLIDRIDYFKNLNINAIELMPVMEFEGNEGWGYNTVFHMALDKFYGTEDKLRELIDVCHQNGIAVILDVALNHAYGRNPMVRMWMDDPDGDGWGGPSSENPYFNQVATHSYSVGSDFNHEQARTQTYVKRVLKHWIEEFKIDGFRWDLTKGFTQACSAGDDSCTDSYQGDRVLRLQNYADESWLLDPSHYVIFEHLGSDAEEQQWANYRLGDAIPKGVMMWSEMWNDYKELALGNSSNIDRMGHTAHGFTGKRTLGYPESHDKDRIMYEMVTYGLNSGGGYDVRDLITALGRMSALGAISIPIPGPKMIWHFADLGMDNSIWLCSDGVTVDSGNDDCKLSTKPQPQWEGAENWLGDANRSQIYSDWARLNWLKINEPVFEGDYAITSGSLTPRIDVFDTSIPDTELKNVIILANFGVSTASVNTSFPTAGTWFDLMDETGSTTISSAVTSINLPAGEFRIYGNKASTLGTKDFESNLDLIVYPNPAKNTFSINKNVSDLKVFDLTGKLVKVFKGDFSKGETFDISTLTRSLYILKITNNSGQQQATKLVKL